MDSSLKKQNKNSKMEAIITSGSNSKQNLCYACFNGTADFGALSQRPCWRCNIILVDTLLTLCLCKCCTPEMTMTKCWEPKGHRQRNPLSEWEARGVRRKPDAAADSSLPWPTALLLKRIKHHFKAVAARSSGNVSHGSVPRCPPGLITVVNQHRPAE